LYFRIALVKILKQEEEESSMNLGIKGKVVIVTGGARGIGASIVEGFAEEGANVVISDIIFDDARGLAEKMTSNGINVLAVRSDVTKKSDTENLVSATLNKFGTIDILVNNAGILKVTSFVDLDEEEWDRVNDVNIKGTYLMSRAVVPHMIAARQGKIINISSLAGKRGYSGLSHYSASKFAVIGFTQTLACELGGYNINVNAVAPGILRTQMWEAILDVKATRQSIAREQYWNESIETIPLKRPQTPEDIANVVLFLSSEIAKNITGETVNVSGGRWMD
jgi:NAD(P)-dependent dehydrogenase (short-subunit alcohol dehydrogenase family)